MTPGQTRKNWLTSARAWFRWADHEGTSKRDKKFAEREGWHSLLRAEAGL